LVVPPFAMVVEARVLWLLSAYDFFAEKSPFQRCVLAPFRGLINKDDTF